ncbi:MAG: hypothetical protein RLP44_27890 [Aggregatilineales bacterium]
MASPTKMFEDGKNLDKVLIVAISAIVFVIFMIAILFFHYISLHYALLNDNSELLHDVDDLQETTDQLQSQLDVLLTTPPDEISSQELRSLDQQLDQMGENLENIEASLEENDVEGAEDIAWVEDLTPIDDANVYTIQKNINRTLLLITWFIGLVSLITALLLTVTLQTRKQKKKQIHSLRRFYS